MRRGEPHDAERIANGDGSNGPAMRDFGISGRHEIQGSADDVDAPRARAFAAWLATVVTATPVEGPGTPLARTWPPVGPWLRPGCLHSSDVAALLGGLLLRV